MSLSPSDTFWSSAVYFHGVAEYFHIILKILTSPKSGPIRQPCGVAHGVGEIRHP